MFVSLYCIYPLEHLRAWVSAALAGFIVVLGGLFGGIDYWCGRAMSPFRAIHTFDFKSLKKIALSEKKINPAFPKLKTSAKSVQTSAVVCTNFSRSLYRLQLKFAEVCS